MTEDIHETPSSTPNFQTELAAQLSELAPEAIADGKIDVEKLKELLDGDAADDGTERFGLFWPGKKRALRAAQEPTTATLRPDIENSKDWDTTKNVFIEGDNLEVLKILQKHYHAKVKMFYIDPPYNTGKDFVYPDNYKEGLDTYLEWTRQVNEEGRKVSSNSETEGRFHSNWLNMMYPRLKLARNLLTDDGVIFISIDDHEQENLKRICNEIFGERNFVVQIVWTNKEGGGSSDSKTFKRKHEYILVFARNIELLDIHGLPVSNESRYTMTDEYESTRGKFYTQKLGMGTIQYSQSLDYPIQTPDGATVLPADNNGGRRACWRWSEQKFKWGIENDYIVFRKNKDGIWIVYTKQYLNADNQGNIIDRTQRPSSVIDSFSTTQASKGMQKIFDGVDYFDYTKPVDLLKQLISIGSDPDSTILDFFSGSGTTAHAVMQLNAEDHGTRKHIQVQLPEPTDEESVAYKEGFRNISEIARERIRRAGKRIKSDNSAIMAERVTPLDLGFRSYKLIDTNFSKWRLSSDIETGDLEQHLLDLRDSRSDGSGTQDDLLTEILVKQGFSLSEDTLAANIDGLDVRMVHDADNEIAVLAYLDVSTKPSLDQLRALADESPTRIIVLEDAFQGDDDLKTNLAQICKSRSIEFWTA